MKNRVLFISATHGDEGFSIPILNELEKKYSRKKYGYDRLIGNPKALQKKRRYLEANLNRSAPGDKNSKLYEDRQAFKVLKEAKKFNYVIDLHGADSRCGVVIIICKPTLPNFILAGMLSIKKIIIWSTKEDYKNGPLTQFCETGLEIECGKKTDPKIQNELKRALEKFIQSYRNITPKEIMNNLKKKKIFLVYDKQISPNERLQDFKKIGKGSEGFYPFMSNLYPGIACYKLKKINLRKLFLSQSKI